MAETLTALTALIGAAISIANSGHAVFVVMFLMLAVLAWKLRECEHKHHKAMEQNQKLMTAAVELGAAVNVLAGNRVVDVSEIKEILAGENAVTYGPRQRGGRRRSDPTVGDDHQGA